MELTVLGANGTYPDRGGACSGYLLRRDGFALWIDAGTGTMGRLQEHVAIEEVGAVFLSHVHPDHCVDLYPFFYALSFHPNRPKGIPVFAPDGVRETMGALLSHGGQEDFVRFFDWRVLNAGDTAEAGPFRLRAFRSVHLVENLTLRAEAGGRVFCYSGDTGPNSDLPRAAEGADLFLCEASWQDADHPELPAIHMRARQAGEAARSAGAGRLVLTHVWPRNDLDVSLGEASDTFSGAVDLAVRSGPWEV